MITKSTISQGILILYTLVPSHQFCSPSIISWHSLRNVKSSSFPTSYGRIFTPKLLQSKIAIQDNMTETLDTVIEYSDNHRKAKMFHVRRKHNIFTSIQKKIKKTELNSQRQDKSSTAENRFHGDHGLLEEIIMPQNHTLQQNIVDPVDGAFLKKSSGDFFENSNGKQSQSLVYDEDVSIKINTKKSPDITNSDSNTAKIENSKKHKQVYHNIFKSYQRQNNKTENAEKKYLWPTEVSRSIIEKAITRLIHQWSIEPPRDLEISSKPAKNFIGSLLLNGEVTSDIKVSFKDLYLRNLFISGGGSLQIKKLSMNLRRFMPHKLSFILKKIKYGPKYHRRFSSPFDIRMSNCVFVGNDLIRSSCVRNGLSNLFQRILNRFEVINASKVNIRSIKILVRKRKKSVQISAIDCSLNINLYFCFINFSSFLSLPRKYLVKVWPGHYLAPKFRLRLGQQLKYVEVAM